MKLKAKPNMVWVAILAAAVSLTFAGLAESKQMVSEARSVIQSIETKSSNLSGQLDKFHEEFSARAKSMVEIEAMVEELKREGYLGNTYRETPERYERVYAEFAKEMAEIKDIFSRHYPRIQSAVSSFNKSIYQGKDRISQIRSDDLAVVDAELVRSKTTFRELQDLRSNLESQCPQNASRQSPACTNQWRNYKRQLTRLKQSLARLNYMKKISNLKNSISAKLSEIMDQYIYKEADIVDTLGSYAFSFEQYADFIGSKDLGGMLRTIRELGQLETKMRDLQQIQNGINFHVADMGAMVDDRLDYFMESSGINVESRDEKLTSYADQEEDIKEMIRQLEKDN